MLDFCYFTFYDLQQHKLTASCYLALGTVVWERITNPIDLTLLVVEILVRIIYLVAIDGDRLPLANHLRSYYAAEKATSMKSKGSIITETHTPIRLSSTIFWLSRMEILD